MRPVTKVIDDTLRPADTDGVEEVKHPIEPPEFELFAQRIVANVGQVRDYVLSSYKESGIDPLQYPMMKAWQDVPYIVKCRVKWLQKQTASNTVADRRELEEFLTQVIRCDPRLEGRRDRRGLNAMDAVKELCKMKGFYSPVEIKNTHEIVVPDHIRRMSDEQLLQITSQAKGEVIDVQSEVAALPDNSSERADVEEPQGQSEHRVHEE